MTITVTTGVLVSATTGTLLCDFGDLHQFLSEVTSGPLWTHQLPDASRAIEAHLRAEHPWLNDVELPPAGAHGDGDPETFWRAVAADLEAKYGSTHEVQPMTDYAHTDPVEDLVRKVGEERVIVVTTNQTAS